jgi:hypothetical protein
MNGTVETVIQLVFDASDAERIHFGKVIGALAAGVESYGIDYQRGMMTCYCQGDAVVEHTIERPVQIIADRFDADGLKAAIRGAQPGRVKFSPNSRPCRSRRVASAIGSGFPDGM